MIYSFVIPCYKSSETIEKVVCLTEKEMLRLGHDNIEFVLVNDCSPDGGATIRALRKIAMNNSKVRVIDLAKNAGQHNAIMAALNYTRGDAVIAMDDDLQTHPSQLSKLLDKYNEGYDVVFGYYPKKMHKAYRNIGAKINSLIVRTMIGKPKNLHASSFWIIRKYIRDEIVKYQFPYTYLEGLFLRTTSNITCVPIEHFEREVGQSGYTMKKLIALSSRTLGFSIAPLRISMFCGNIFAFIGVMTAIVTIIRKIVDPSVIAGWSSMFAGICFFSGIILIFLGMIGEYIGRMFLSLTNTPQYVIREIITYNKDK